MKKLLLALLMLSSTAFGAFTVPELKHPVNDYSTVLTKTGKEEIAKAIVNLKKETGAQAGVLIVETLGGESIEEASMKVARAWKLGSTQKDDGILVLIVTKDRKIRIEVGRGLESVVTDANSIRIIQTMKSALKSGNFDAGVLAGVNGIATQIKNNKENIQAKVVPTTSEDSTPYIVLGIFLLAILITAVYVIHKQESEDVNASYSPLFVYTPPVLDTRTTRKSDNDDVNMAVLAAAAVAVSSRRRQNDDDDSSSRSSSRSSDDSSSSSSSDYSSSSSDWGGGGGDFSGGGSSDSF